MPAGELHSPSTGLLAQLRSELMQVLPFARMSAAHVEQFIAAAQQAYFAPGEVLLDPATGPVPELHYVRQGSITAQAAPDDGSGPIEYGAGELFPIDAVCAGRAVAGPCTAHDDSFCLLVPAAAMWELAAHSAPFADFLNRRSLQLLEQSRQALQLASASRALAEQSLEASLDSLPQKRLLSCAPETALRQALTAMHERQVGSILVVDGGAAPLGILTRHDILDRVTLPQCALDTPISAVMTAPVHALGSQHTLHDALLAMSRHGLRHLPVTEGGRLVNIVSERDLFALQRLSLKQLSSELRAAREPDSLRPLAEQIRRLARQLLGQGVQARQLTELISHLNDLLTERLVQLLAERRGVDLARACWLAFGSEGRGEQTVATDQDNGLVFDSDDAPSDRPAWLALAREVNAALDACGYPLCQGQVMASNPECCLSPAEWQQRFDHWIEHGAPQDLLDASIHFDLRPLAGQAALAGPLRERITQQAKRWPRFLKQMADNALLQRPALNWRGALDTQDVNGRAMLDLKQRGTAVFVGAARLFALAHGVSALGTRARLEAVAPLMHVAPSEGQAWIAAFEFLQMLRLRLQIGDASQPTSPAVLAAAQSEPNQIDLGTLNHMDLRMLKEACRVARGLQQRIELDYPN